MSSGQDETPKGNLTFVAVARAQDRVILAVMQHGSSVDLQGVKHLLAPDQMSQVEVGRHYTFGAGASVWHMQASEQQLVYVCVTAPSYPTRHAHALLEELKRTFAAKCGDKAATARDGALTNDCKGLFKKLCIKYDDVAQLDVLNRTLDKVQGVKLIMQENIEIALKNCVSLEAIDKQAEDLQAQAGVFKTRAKTLRSKMWWKLCKMRLLVAAVIICILIAIIVPIVIMTEGNDKKKK